MRLYKILIPLLLCLNIKLIAQDEMLNKKVSIQYKDAKVKDILLGLEVKYGAKFYYANNMIPLAERVSVTVKNKSLKEALEEVFKTTNISFQVVDNKIVLRKDTSKKKIKETPKTSYARATTETVSIDPHAIYPAFTLAEVQTVPVVDESTFETALIAIPIDTSKPLDASFIAYKNRILKSYMSKMDSLGRIGNIGAMEELKSKFSAAMGKLKMKIQAAADSLKAKEIPLFKDKNDSTILQTPFQVTFVPPYGTNGTYASNVINNVSLNALVGKAYGMEGAEFAGLVNIERAHVQGVQAAGIANIVGTNVRGVQFAGITNTTGGAAEGAQFAGIINLIKAESNGLQAAGIANIVKGVNYGVQFAGITNINGDSATGFQASGITNVTKGSYDGTQLAGIANIHKGSSAGFMAAGIANVSQGPTRGLRVAGIANVSGEEHNGMQIAGIFNKAKRVRGSQIGLINKADTVTGVTVGLINLVKNGYNKFEVYTADALHANAAFRFGSARFHTMITVGAKLADKKENIKLSYGFGFGSFWSLSDKTGLTIDLLANHINEGVEDYTTDLNLLNQLRVSFEYKIANHFKVFAGPSINVMVANDESKKRKLTNLSGYDFFNETYTNRNNTNVNVQIWVGYYAGIRF